MLIRTTRPTRRRRHRPDFRPRPDKGQAAVDFAWLLILLFFLYLLSGIL